MRGDEPAPRSHFLGARLQPALCAVVPVSIKYQLLHRLVARIKCDDALSHV